MRPVIIITALRAEARPLISRLGLKQGTGSPVDDRFQAFRGDGLCVAISGIGRMRSAIATTALLSIEKRHEDAIIVNLGICGASENTAPIGSIFLINKVTDVATGARYYPDILLKHKMHEAPLETCDRPVVTTPEHGLLVDMEGSGFAQASSMFTSPSQVLILKVISDHCTEVTTTNPITPAKASWLIADHFESILTIVEQWQAELPLTAGLENYEEQLLRDIVRHAHFTRSEEQELMRVARSAKARQKLSLCALEKGLSCSITCRREGKEILQKILVEIQGDSLP